jgi:thioredoxin 1
MYMSIVNLTKENFETEVLQSSKPVLIDFWAAWCGPCRMLSPVVDEIAEEREEVKICKINVDEQPELASAFQVMSIPTMAFLKNGKVVDQSVGVKPKTAILSMIQA